MITVNSFGFHKSHSICRILYFFKQTIQHLDFSFQFIYNLFSVSQPIHIKQQNTFNKNHFGVEFYSNGMIEGQL